MTFTFTPRPPTWTHRQVHCTIAAVLRAMLSCAGRPKLAQVEGLGNQMGQGMLCGESGFESGLEFGSMTAERNSSQGGKVPGAGCGWEKVYEQWLDPQCDSHASTSHSLGFGPVMGPMDPCGRNSWRETTLNHIVKSYSPFNFYESLCCC